MNDRQHYLKNTTTLMLVAFLIVAASITFVAYADEHQDTVEYDIDEMDDFELDYPNIVEVTGDSIEEGDEFVLYYEGDRIDAFEADEDGVVTIDSTELDTVPTGDYILADAPEGDVTGQEETEDGDSVVVEEASSNVEYTVSIHEEDEEGNPVVDENVGIEGFDAGTEIVDYEISTTETLNDEDTYFVALTDVEDDDILDVYEIDSLTFDGYDADNDVNEEEIDRLMAPFEIVGDGDFGDERYEQDFDMSESLTTVYVGQELILGSDTLDEDSSYELYYHDEDDNKNLVQDLSVHESDRFNTHELRVDTELDDSDFGPEGDFTLEEDNDEIISWSAVEQDLDAELNDSTVNLYTDNTDVDLNVTSTNRGSGYDVLVHNEELDAEELYDLIESEELTNSEVHIEDEEDDDNEQVRITNLDTSETDEFTIPLEFEDADEDTYEFELEVADSTAEATTDEIEVDFFDDGAATFDQGTYTQNQGDIVEFTVQTDETTEATLEFTEDDYELEFDVHADSQGDDVVIQMDTYRAGDHHDYTVDDVFNVVEGGEIPNAEDIQLPAVSGNFDTGLYSMELYVADRNTDLSSLLITDRESDNIESWVMPQGSDADLNEVEEVGTRQENVAMEDMFVVEVEASGLYNQDLLNNETEVSDFVDKSEFELDITERDSDRHKDNTTLNVSHAADFEIDADENKFYMFFDTQNDDIFETESGEYDVNEEVEYDIEFNLLNDYKYVDDEDDTDQNLHETAEFVERDIVTNLPSVTVDEETLETKHGLAAVENSTVAGDTYIAPGTDDIDIVVRTEGSEENDAESDFFSERVEVTDDGTVSAEFNLSHIAVDRDMQIQYRPIDDDYRDAVMMEADEPPEIEEFSSDDTPVTEGNEVTFNVDVNSTSDSLNYEWDFDDGETSQQTDPAHVYDEAGTYDVELTVTDNADQSATETTEIVVEEAPNEPPVIEDIIADEEVDVGEDVTFTAIAFDEEDQDELEYTWDFDDGSTSTGVSTTHAFDSEGTYDVELTVMDTEGESTTDSVTVQVTGEADDEDEDDGPHELTMTTVDSDTDDPIPSVSLDVEEDGEIVEDVQTDENGVAIVELEDGDYDIEASVDGYEDFSAGAVIDDGDEEIDLIMTLEDDGDDEDPSQPGFTAVIAAIALIAGSLIAYRRKQ